MYINILTELSVESTSSPFIIRTKNVEHCNTLYMNVGIYI